MQRLEVSGAVRSIDGPLGVKRLIAELKKYYTDYLINITQIFIYVCIKS